MSAAGHQAARVDRVDRRVRAIGRARDFAELVRQVGVAERLRLLLLLDHRIVAAVVRRAVAVVRVVRHRVRLVLQERRARIAQAETRVLERIEVVAFAHPHERLAAVVHLLEIVERFLHRRERDVRVVAQLGRPFGAACRAR